MKPLPNTPFAPLGARRMLAALVIVFGCSCDGESPTDTNGGPPPTNIVFHFDSNPGSEFNPTITNGPVTISFVTDATVNSAGVVQFVNDFRAIPYRGKGNLRLSKGAGGQPGFDVAVDLHFNIDVYAISLHAFQGDELAGMPVTTPFTFEGFDGNGTSLGLMATTEFADYANPVYEGISLPWTAVRRIRLSGLSNVSHLDELVVNTVPKEPSDQPVSSPLRTPPPPWGSRGRGAGLHE